MNPIETEQLTRRFRRTVAVDDFTFTVPEGSVCVLLGANGAGKTTLIKLLLGLIEPSHGRARVFGVPSERLSPVQFAEIGYVSENLQPPAHLTVAEHLARWRPFYPQWDRAYEARLLREFDLPSDRKLRHLSRGMAMKAKLLSVLPFRPRLLVLDEPFGGLDPLVRDQVAQSLADLAAEEGRTILVSSHDIAEVETLATHAVWIERGRLQLCESVESLQLRFRRVELDTPGSGGTPRVPDHAFAVARSGRRLRYIDPQFDARAISPHATTQGLSLREIFIALLRERRSGLTAPTSEPVSR